MRALIRTSSWLSPAFGKGGGRDSLPHPRRPFSHFCLRVFAHRRSSSAHPVRACVCVCVRMYVHTYARTRVLVREIHLHSDRARMHVWGWSFLNAHTNAAAAEPRLAAPRECLLHIQTPAFARCSTTSAPQADPARFTFFFAGGSRKKKSNWPCKMEEKRDRRFHAADDLQNSSIQRTLSLLSSDVTASVRLGCCNGITIEFSRH